MAGDRVVVPDARASLAALAAGDSDRPPVEAPLVLPEGSTSAAVTALVHDGAARLQFTVPGPGLLVVNESWRAGWRARVDGGPAPVHRVGGAMLGVVVPADAGTVELYFRPDGWIHGQRWFLVGAVGLLALLGLSLRRRATWVGGTVR